MDRGFERTFHRGKYTISPRLVVRGEMQTQCLCDSVAEQKHGYSSNWRSVSMPTLLGGMWRLRPWGRALGKPSLYPAAPASGFQKK